MFIVSKEAFDVTAESCIDVFESVMLTDGLSVHQKLPSAVF